MNKEQQINKLTQESEYAAHGQVVVNNPAYKEAFEARKAKIFNDFCNSKPDEQEKREEAWRTMQNMMALEQYFNFILSSGKMADETLKQFDELN